MTKHFKHAKLTHEEKVNIAIEAAETVLRLVPRPVMDALTQEDRDCMSDELFARIEAFLEEWVMQLSQEQVQIAGYSFGL